MISYALNLVFRRKLRTLLTSMGITISVLLLGSIIFGMLGLRNVITQEIDTRFAPDQIIVSSQDFGFGDLFSSSEEDSMQPVEPVFMTPDIVDELRQAENVELVDPQLVLTGYKATISGLGKAEPFDPAFVAGIETVENVTYILDFVGNEFSPGQNEVFIGNAVADFYGAEPEELIGRKVVIEPSFNSFFSVKSEGILEKSYEFTITGFVDAGTDRIDVLMSPEQAALIAAERGGFEGAQEYLDTFGYDQAIVTVNEPGNVGEVAAFFEATYGFSTITSEDLGSFVDQLTGILTLVLFVFGSISAVIASIGIINTMVMSIYEQTREIGIIKAIGASNTQVLSIFIIQSGMIGLIGGLIGVIILIVLMQISDPLIVEEIQKEGFVAEEFFNLDLVVLFGIILCSILVGVIAGVYPAMRAARLDPVKALRYE